MGLNCIPRRFIANFRASNVKEGKRGHSAEKWTKRLKIPDLVK
jgi:hypothetical protein